MFYTVATNHSIEITTSISGYKKPQRGDILVAPGEARGLGITVVSKFWPPPCQFHLASPAKTHCWLGCRLFLGAMRYFEKEKAEPDRIRFWRERLASSTFTSAKRGYQKCNPFYPYMTLNTKEEARKKLNKWLK
ncbi:hypothetical protein [Lunatibacter salilacus]|uniref:hypothetical protein n=1 Tax=Lunatibacter salilacus TaxID=2483804 RepID=UPI00131A7B1E|nr:hypothetical protein [Lunatibacter salilacus]